MTALRQLLAILWLVIVGYTGFTIANHGWNLFPIFFGDIAKMGWPGQFNVDFSCFLILSATWLAWRHHFSGAGLLLGFLGFVGGMLFLSTYLLVVISKDKPDMAELFLGKQRAGR
jgi:hypothetical protein